MGIKMAITPSCQIFKGLSLPALVKWLTLWKQTIGYEPLRKNLTLLALKKLTRFRSLPTILKEPLLYGGIMLRLCGLRERKLRGLISRTNFSSIIFQLVS